MVFLRATVLALALYIAQGDRWTTTRVGVVVFVPKIPRCEQRKFERKLLNSKVKVFRINPSLDFYEMEVGIFSGD